MDKRIIPCGNKYESKIYVIDDTKEIYKLECLCWNFKNKRIIKHGQFSDIKYFSTPCKHLQPFVDRLLNIGYTLKQPKLMEGSDKLSAALRKKLLERANNHCEALVMGEICQSNEGLEVHRKIPRTSGGKYNETNCQVLCREHHQLVTYQPWQ